MGDSNPRPFGWESNGPTASISRPGAHLEARTPVGQCKDRFPFSLAFSLWLANKSRIYVSTEHVLAYPTGRRGGSWLWFKYKMEPS